MKKYFRLLLLVFIPFILNAQILTLDDAVNAALSNSIALEDEIYQFENEESYWKQNLYSWLPSTQISVDKRINNGDGQDIQGGFQVNWGLTSDETRFFSMKKQLISMENAGLSLEDKQKQIAWQVLKLYIDVLESYEMQKLQEEVVRLEQERSSSVNTKYDIGEASQFEKDEAEINSLQAEINLNNLTNDTSLKRAELFYYINLEDNQEELQEITLKQQSLDYTFQDNLQLQTMKNEQRIRKLNQKQTFLSSLPKLSLNLNYSQTSGDGLFEFSEYIEDSSISLGLVYSFSNYFSLKEDRSLLRRQYDYFERKFNDSRKDYQIQLTNLTRQLDNKRMNYQLYQQKRQLAENLLEQATLRYELGEISMLDFYEYQNNYYSSRKSEISEYYSLLLTQESINLLLSKEILGKW